jgi:pyruvate dehydrogenase E2 component (dihydrolipoamide acetyltransferase)
MMAGEAALMSDLVAIVMPKWGLSMEEGTVAQWHFAEGDEVPRGAELVDIETSKLINTLEAKQAGTLHRIVCPQGAGGACGALIAVMGEGAAPSPAELDAFVAQFAVALSEDDPSGAQAGPGHSTITVDGVALHYADIGTGAEAVLFLHGFGGDSGNWRFVQSELAAHYRTIALDLPGHGGSDKTLAGAGSLPELAALVGRFVAALGVDRVHLVGHSFGGAVARHLAARGDAAIASLTLVAPLFPGCGLDRSFLTDFVSARRNRDLRDVLARLVADPGSISRAMVEDALRHRRLDGVLPVFEHLIALADQEAAAGADDLPVPVPALAIWGESDRIIPLPPGGLPGDGTRTAVIGGAGHLPHLEQPAQVARILLEALTMEARGMDNA